MDGGKSMVECGNGMGWERSSLGAGSGVFLVGNENRPWPQPPLIFPSFCVWTYLHVSLVMSCVCFFFFMCGDFPPPGSGCSQYHSRFENVCYSYPNLALWSSPLFFSIPPPNPIRLALSQSYSFTLPPPPLFLCNAAALHNG